MVMRIALVGKMRSGKTTAKNYLVEQHGFTPMAFAGPVKELAAEVMDLVEGYLGFGGIAWDREKIERRKSEPAIRSLLQLLGTDIGRGMYGENVWVTKLLNELEPGVSYVIDDARFPNEADALRKEGFVIVKLQRPETDRLEQVYSEYGPGAAEILRHPSEMNVDSIKSDSEFYVPDIRSIHYWIDYLVETLTSRDIPV
jgi:hypothetical protein